MGVEDRDWWREAQRQRAAKARAAGAGRRSRGLAWRGALGIVVFWLAVMGALYAGMSYWSRPRTVTVQADGALVIPRHADGHFRVAGSVNGEPAMFLVDTGASLVSVSDSLARRARLGRGEPATFHTANGARSGRIVLADAVAVRGMVVTGLRVGTGYTGRSDDEALLGQNFLQQFDVELRRDRMVLRPRAAQ